MIPDLACQELSGGLAVPGGKRGVAGAPNMRVSGCARGAGAPGGWHGQQGYAWARGLRNGLIHTPSDSSPISKQKQARRREEPATCRDKAGEKRQKNREKEKGRREEKLVLPHCQPVHLSVRGCPGAQG